MLTTVGSAHPTITVSEYRRWYVQGGSYFFTVVTYLRRPLFAAEENVIRLRSALATVMQELPFEIAAAVILPDHAHFLWTLPQGDAKYSKRIGRMKVEFTKQVRPVGQSSLRCLAIAATTS